MVCIDPVLGQFEANPKGDQISIYYVAMIVTLQFNSVQF